MQNTNKNRAKNNISLKVEKNFLFLLFPSSGDRHRARLQRHSMNELKEAVRELLQCIIMGLSYKNVYYQ